MVKLFFSGLCKSRKQFVNPFRERQLQAKLSGDIESSFQVFNLILDKAARSKIPINHTLSVKFQDSALAESAHDCFANSGRIGASFFCQCETLRNRANSDRNDALVDKLAELSSPVRTYMSHVSPGSKNRTRIQNIRFFTAGHYRESTLFRSNRSSGHRGIDVA
jgi:hypothetical protein